MGRKLKKILKPVQKIIPKEIRPALPFILPFIPGIGPALGSMQSALTSKLAMAGKLAPYLSQGIMAAGTQAVTDPNAKTSDLFRTAALSVAPAAISEGLGALPTDKGIGKFLSETAKGADATRLEKIQAALGKVDPGKTGYASQLDVATGSVPVSEVAKIVGPEGFTKAATLAAAQTGLSQAPIVARMNEQALRDYEAQLREQGIMDSSERRNKIFGYFTNAGYGVDETNAFLDKYGYKDGGKVKKVSLKDFAKDFEKKLKNRRQGLKRGGSAGVVAELLRLRDDEGKPVYTYEEAVEKADEYFPEDFNFDLGSLQAGISGLETAFGRSFMAQPKPVPMMRFADGGITSTEEAKVYMTDDNSGVQYLDSEGNPITKEEFFKGTDEAEREGKAIGGIMNVSDLNNERFLEQRAEQYMEEGFSPEDAMDKALDDLKNNRFPALKDGGMMNLGGREMDMRSGGFIPIGKKERADDVPARLSKNEFVMTADAVRGAGNGSINKGAKRMYDLMNKLESKV